MQLAIITPVKYLNLSIPGHFFFSLAHVLRESEQKKDYRYRDFFKKQSESKNTVFLDNGAHEQELVSGQELFDLGVQIQATHIICPDSLGNFEYTKELTSKFLEITPPADYSPKYIGVCQAQNWSDFSKLYKSYLENDKIDTIALPYDLELFSTEELADSPTDADQLEKKISYRNMKSRIHITNKLQSQGLLQKNIHLLGWSLPQEIWYQNKIPRSFKSKLSNDSQGYCVYPELVEFKPERSLREQLMKFDTKLSTPLDFFRDLDETKLKDIESFINRYKKEMTHGRIFE